MTPNSYHMFRYSYYNFVTFLGVDPSMSSHRWHLPHAKYFDQTLMVSFWRPYLFYLSTFRLIILCSQTLSVHIMFILCDSLYQSIPGLRYFIYFTLLFSVCTLVCPTIGVCICIWVASYVWFVILFY